MGNFKIGIFEIFAGILPGLPILIIIFSLYNSINISSINWDMIIGYDFSLGSLLILSVLSYLIGFTLQYPAYEVFKFIFKNTKIWEKRKCGKKISLAKRGEEISKIRLNSPESYNILNVFMGLRTMCYTLFLSIVIFNIVYFFQLICDTTFNFKKIIVLALLVFSNVIILRRAISFHEWSHKLISNTNSVLEKKH